MPQFRADGSAVVHLFAKWALIAAFGLGTSQIALAADHRILPQTAKFDCSRVNPGDTVTLQSGTRGSLAISDCEGTLSNPIIIRNDPNGNGPTVLSRASGARKGFIFSCHSCIGVEIDGSYKWNGAPSGKTYGIKLTMTGGEGPSAFMSIKGYSRIVTIRNVEIDGAWPRLRSWGSGIRINDLSVNRNNHPGLWREKILIEDNYIHDIRNEGMYVGPNYKDGDIPLRDVEIRYNRVEDTGWDAINTKSMWAGNNSIHHNEVRRAGKNTEDSSKSAQYSGIKNISGTVKIYNNWIETTGQHGIMSWTGEGPKTSENRGPFLAQIWNNVVVDAGSLWRPFMQRSYGISVGAQDGCEKPVPLIYSNTIVNSRSSSISVTGNTEAGFVRDNIVAGAGANPAIIVPRFVDLINNRIGSVTQMGFVDAGRRNYRLNVNSPALNGGSNLFPQFDHDDVSRPKYGAPDQGAFERQ